MDLNSRETFDVNTTEGKRRLLGLPVRGGDEGEFAIAGGAGEFSVGSDNGRPTKQTERIDIPTGGGAGGGAKAQRDILESLRGTLINLNAEWRKWDAALLDSANSAQLLADKEQVLAALLSSLPAKVRLAISSAREAGDVRTDLMKLSERDEAAFRKWYAEQARKWNLDLNPDDPGHQYDYRRAFKAGVSPGPDGHWPSQFKLAGHPNRFIDGIDTITGKLQTLSAVGKDVDEVLERAIGSLPKESQAAARALVDEAVALSKHIQERRAAVELDKEATKLSQSWRMEIDNSRTGADEFTKAIQGLERAYAKYGHAIDPATRAELDHLAAQQRVLRLTRERLTVLNQIRQRVVGDNILRDLGGGSLVFRGEASRDRVATVGQQVLREREAMRLNEMREIAEDLGAIFGDVFESIGSGWENMWRDMARTAQSISRQIVQELFTALASRAFNVPFQSQSGGIVGGIINRILGSNRSAAPVSLGGGSSFFPGGTGDTRPRTVAGSRAGGGPVEAGLLYRVNEYRQEFFKPNQGGQVIPLGPQPQQSQNISRLFLVDDERAAYERGATRREIARINKHSRKIGKLVPG